MTNVIELARKVADESGFQWCVNYVELELFAKLVGNATLEQAKQLAWTEIMREGALVTWGDAETLGDRVIEKLESLKEPTP